MRHSDRPIRPGAPIRSGSRAHVLAPAGPDVASRRLPSIALYVVLALAAMTVFAARASQAAGEAPKLYATGLVGGAWATGDVNGSTTPDGNFSGSSTDHNVFGGGALGTTLDVGFSDLRLELEAIGGRNFTYKTPVTSGTYVTDAKTWTLQGNFWFEYPLSRLFPDMPVVRHLAPFAGGGLGLSQTSLETSGAGGSGSSDSSTLAWQVGAGLAYSLTPWLVVETRYQYADLGGPSVDLSSGGTPQGSLDYDFGTHEVVGGVRFLFHSF